LNQKSSQQGVILSVLSRLSLSSKRIRNGGRYAGNNNSNFLHAALT
jgi:hypothetical protein